MNGTGAEDIRVASLLARGNLALIGARCSGKTSVGRRLAARLERRFIDLDRLLEERSGLAIETLVATHGWAHFRRLEAELLAEVCQGRGLVLATGGGVVIQPENVRLLRRSGLVLWLRAPAACLRARMQLDRERGMVRPSLSGADPAAEIDAVLAARNPLYQQAAHLVIDTGELTPEQVVQEIICRLAAAGCQMPADPLPANNAGSRGSTAAAAGDAGDKLSAIKPSCCQDEAAANCQWWRPFFFYYYYWGSGPPRR